MNFRAFLLIFVGAVIGVIFSVNLLQKNLLYFIISIVLGVGLILFVVLTSFLSKQKKFAFVNKFIICFLIGFFIFLGLSLINFKTYNKGLTERENVQIQSRVCNVSEKNGYYYLILENCVLNNEEKVDGKISFTLYCSDEMLEINVGDNLKFEANLIVNSVLKEGKFNSYYYKNDLKYYCYANSDVVEVNSGKLYFDEICQKKVREILFDNLSYNNASIAYASIFGDKAMLDNGIKNAFSISGTAHLLCVSGLHVGFLATLIYFLLNLCKINKKYSFVIITILLILYSYICGFSPSVVRASLMSIIFAFADASGKVRYDSLSSLSFAGILILLFKPFYVFDVGFQLSFAACFGIILLNPMFLKLLRKINFENKITAAFCLTFSAQLGTFPILMHSFEKLSFLSIIANVIIVPLFSVIFMFTIVIVILCLFLPFGFLFKITELSLNVVVFLTKSFGAVNECVFATTSSPLITNIFFYASLLLFSEIINLKSKIKAVCVLSMVFLCALSFALQFYPTTYNQNLIIGSSSENFTIITNTLNQKFLISCGNIDENDVSLLKNDSFNYKIFNFNAFIIADYNQDMQSSVTKICNNFKVKYLYLTSNEKIEDIEYLFKNLSQTKIVLSSEIESFSNISFSLNKNLKSIYLTILDEDSIFSIFLCNNINSKLSQYIVDNEIKANYLKTKIIDEKFVGCLSGFDNVLCYKSNFNQINVFDINKICDKIELGEEIRYAF